MNAPHRNASLVAKSNARLAAAQLLYRLARTHAPLKPEKLAADYADYLEDHKSDPKEAALPQVPPNKAMLRKLLEGIAAHGQALDDVVNAHLDTDWKRERMSPLLLAVLKLGAYELDASRTLATPVLVDEYTALARRFFDEQEVSFVHAALQRIALKLRG